MLITCQAIKAEPASDHFDSDEELPSRGRGSGRGKARPKRKATRKMTEIDDLASSDGDFCTDNEEIVVVPKAPKAKRKTIKVNIPDFDDPDHWKPFLRNPMPPDWAGWLSVESDPVCCCLNRPVDTFS